MCRNVFANKLVKHFDKVENEDKQQTKKAQIKWRRENKSRVKYTQYILSRKPIQTINKIKTRSIILLSISLNIFPCFFIAIMCLWSLNINRIYGIIVVKTWHAYKVRIFFLLQWIVHVWETFWHHKCIYLCLIILILF